MKIPIEWAKTVTLEVDIEGKKGIIYHGDDYALLDSLIDSQKYDIVFTGHKHCVRNEKVGKTLVINPGTTCYASEGKIIKNASVVLYDSKTDKVEIIYF